MVKKCKLCNSNYRGTKENHENTKKHQRNIRKRNRQRKQNDKLHNQISKSLSGFYKDIGMETKGKPNAKPVENTSSKRIEKNMNQQNTIRIVFHNTA